ncbi:hypothetical protein BGZ98_001234, partial [Dissophora globulifera]
MTERASNPVLSRGPLQDSKGQVDNLLHHSGPWNPGATQGTPASLTSKIGQENALPQSRTSLSSATLHSKTLVASLATAGDDKDHRHRIALLQKPASGSNVLSAKSQRATNHPLANAPQKLKSTGPAPTPALASAANLKREQAAPLSTPGEGAVGQTAPQTRLGNTRPVYGSPAWIEGMTAMLPKFRFYFDNIEPNTVVKLSKTLVVYGSTIAKFFSNDVTHVVTTSTIPNKDVVARSKTNSDKNQGSSQNSTVSRASAKLTLKPTSLPLVPSAEDSILVKAMGFGIKIWSLERLTNLLTPLFFEPIGNNKDQNLQELLRNEKNHGLATTQVDESQRSEYYIFKNPYLLVEDAMEHYRTIIAYEYTAPPSSKSHRPCPWPKIHLYPSSKSPFVPDPSRYNNKQVENTKADMKQELKDDKVQEQRPQEMGPKAGLHRSPSASALVSGIANSVTSKIIPANTAIGKAQGLHSLQHQGRVLEQLEKRVLNATMADVGRAPTPAPDTKKNEFARPAEVIKTTITMNSTIPGAKEPLADVDAIEPAAEIEPPLDPMGVELVPVPPEMRPEDPVRQNGQDITHTTAAAKSVSKVSQPRVFTTAGYCENCWELYKDFEQHIATPEHRRYAHDATKFERLDKLLFQLRRKSKTISTVAECPPNSAGRVEGKPTKDEVVALNDDRVSKEIASVEGKSGSNTLTDQQEPSLSMPLLSGKKAAPAGQAIDNDGDDNPQQDEEAVATTPVDEQQPEIETQVHDQEKEQVHIAGDKEEAEDEDDLSSEMSRLGVSQTGEEHDDDDAVPAEKDTRHTAEIARTNTSAIEATSTIDDQGAVDATTDRTFYLRMPLSDKVSTSEANTHSLIRTDITQPDDRFLDQSVADSQAFDTATPIQLALSMSSVCADSTEPVFSALADKDEFVLEESSEGDKEFEDAVALLKSPSAGRGAFAKSQRGNVKRDLGFLSSGQPTSMHSLKRKLEKIQAEERAAKVSGGKTLNAPRPMVYDDELAMRILSRSHRQVQQQQQQQHSRTPLRPISWSQAPPSMSSALSSPLQFDLPSGHPSMPTPFQSSRLGNVTMGGTPVFQSLQWEQEQQPHRHHLQQQPDHSQYYGTSNSIGGASLGHGYPQTSPFHSRERHHQGTNISRDSVYL